MFKTIDQFKQAAQFFPNGRIIPQRIFKADRKIKHKITFAGNSWALPTPNGYVVAVDVKSSCPSSVMQKMDELNIKPLGGIYAGPTHWICNIEDRELTDQEWLDRINEHIK